MGARQGLPGSLAARVTYLLEPKNWLIVTVVGVGFHADGVAGAGWGLLAALFAAVLPTVFISYGIRRGHWDDRNVGARRPRLVVLAFIAASVATGLILLAVLGAPVLLTGYLAIMLVSVAGLALITLVWKISIHCAVASGSVAILAFTYGPLVLAGYLLVGLLGWSRVAVRDHSWLQVAGGTVLGAAAAALAYAAFLSCASAGAADLAGAADQRQDRTTASGQMAWATPAIRSASPTWPMPRISSAPNQATRTSSTTTAVAATAGRRPQGTAGPRRQAPAGQVTSPASPATAAMMCGTGYVSPARSGLAATSMPASTPAIRISRPAARAGRSASAVTM